ncbi:MAG: phosphoribosylformylglycinamidine cyclo-ligase [Methanomicrobiales archaeon]|nr:phosphoribosylformylglycinamidine cyclo-ligase [Methanomicrobiales archaeon]
MTEKTYKDAGVDIDLEALAVSTLISKLTFQRKGEIRPASGSGHFAGMVSFGEYVLALATDGVGTKMLVADEMQNWSTVGIDCIAMNVNDLYVMNLEPIAFVDYIATDSLSLPQMEQIGEGLNRGAELSNISIIGGETATLKGMVTGLDLAGTVLGIQKQSDVITGEKIIPGDLIMGVPSSGIHSNGLTLARSLVHTHAGMHEVFHGKTHGKTYGEELLTPTRIYHEVLSLTKICDVHGMCHITGGGLLNLKRLSKYGFSITDPLPPQEIYSWMQKMGNISDFEMYKTFNMGMGYVIIVPPSEEYHIKSVFSDAQVVGVVTDTAGVFLRDKKME